jgi:hypothetical protein
MRSEAGTVRVNEDLGSVLVLCGLCGSSAASALKR